MEVGSGEQPTLGPLELASGDGASHDLEHVVLVEPVEAYQHVEEGREPGDASSEDQPLRPQNPTGFSKRLKPIRPVDQVIQGSQQQDHIDGP